MIKSLEKIAIVFLLASVGYYVYANYLTACSTTLAYDIGTVDPRFGVTEEQVIKISQETEGVWETPFGTQFFKYDPNSKFKINLIFDDRQQRTIDERNSRTVISSQQDIYRNKVASYQAKLTAHTQANTQYESDLAAYQARLDKYNQEVDYYNKNGGAPAKDYQRLQQEKLALQREATRLDGVRRQLNNEVVAINQLGEEINALAKDLNLDVDAYNGKFGTTHEFDQGSYTGKAINIYEFSDADDLHLVLAHEFGHALGLEHIDDPQAIMYYLMDKQNIKNLQLTESDKAALRSTCHIR